MLMIQMDLCMKNIQWVRRSHDEQANSFILLTVCSLELIIIYIRTFYINKIEVEQVKQKNRLVEFAGHITLSGNQQ